ncbi:hypothetical protein ACI48D_20035 [Massilia sp. LXY-6]|uniref:hypothetical protein n=1 Tax=Massilia sp. LXY-6 TaxID=3379823 RepID=UPI003EDED750
MSNFSDTSSNFVAQVIKQGIIAIGASWAFTLVCFWIGMPGLAALNPFLVVVGLVVYNIRRKVAKKQAIKVHQSQRAADEQNREAARQRILEKQRQLEEAEKRTKAANPCLNVAEVFLHPNKFTPYRKFSVGTEADNMKGEMEGLWSIEEKMAGMKKPAEVKLNDLVFFTENMFEVVGVLEEGNYRIAVRFFGLVSNNEDKGYGETSRQGFLLKLSVTVGNERRPVYLVVPHVYEKRMPQQTGGYEAVDNGSPFDDFGFSIAQGTRLRAVGHLYRREATQHDFFPLGYYLVAEMKDVQPAESVKA